METVLERNEVVVFENGELRLDVNVTPGEDTVWLNVYQMSELFGRDEKTIRKHIKNVLSEELDNSTVAKFATVQKEGNRNVKRDTDFYNLDMIISVGYRVKSKNGILFRKWANKILKDYLMKGYAVNERHYQDIDYVTRILNEYKNAGGELPDSESMLAFLTAYQRGFKILDDYDHHSLDVPVGSKGVYVIEYEECMNVINRSMFANKGSLFAIEKDNSFRSSIATIYQSFAGVELYPTIEDKASALLYFIVKNHGFADGNKRIGATIFLYFLERNHALYKNGKERISNETLVTLTILVASSRPEDKDIIMALTKTIIH